jgi:hypothetical protein
MKFNCAFLRLSGLDWIWKELSEDMRVVRWGWVQWELCVPVDARGCDGKTSLLIDSGLTWQKLLCSLLSWWWSFCMSLSYDIFTLIKFTWHSYLLTSYTWRWSIRQGREARRKASQDWNIQLKSYAAKIRMLCLWSFCSSLFWFCNIWLPDDRSYLAFSHFIWIKKASQRTLVTWQCLTYRVWKFQVRHWLIEVHFV